MRNQWIKRKTQEPPSRYGFPYKDIFSKYVPNFEGATYTLYPSSVTYARPALFLSPLINGLRVKQSKSVHCNNFEASQVKQDKKFEQHRNIWKFYFQNLT